jgi:hypothetical protein
LDSNGPVKLPYFLPPHGVDLRTFCVPQPSWALVQWLWMLTPPGASVIPIGDYVPHGTKEYDLDAYAVKGVPCLQLGAQPQMPGIRSSRQGEIRKRMPAAYRREPGRHAPRAGVPKWQMEAAFYRDLVGLTTAKLADELDFRDDSTRAAENGSRSARRYVEAGRVALMELGAWPWALEPENGGRLPAGWHYDLRYAAALAGWHHRETCETIEDCLSAVESAAGSTERWRTAAAAEVAREAYQRMYAEQLKATPPE